MEPLVEAFGFNVQCSHPRSIIVRSPPGYRGRAEASKREFNVPCGHCTNCRIAKSREWVMRCLHEKTVHSMSSFLTLTYNEETNPTLLVPRDLQLFFKRLRKALPRLKLKYLACGEYGEKNFRPHYHIILFGWEPKEFTIDPVSKKIQSTLLKEVWPYGLHHVGTVTAESIRYCADYVLKSTYVPKKDKDEKFQYPFIRVSQGLGLNYAQANKERITELTLNGVPQSVPRYYAKKLGLDMAEITKEARAERDLLLAKIPDSFDLIDADQKLGIQRGFNADAKLKLIGEKRL